MRRAHSLVLLSVLVSSVLTACGVPQTGADAPTAAPTSSLAPSSTSVPPLATPAPTVLPAPTAPPATPAPTASTTTTVTFNTPFAIKVNETVKLPSDLSLTFKGATNDSRCPSNVACVWAGAVDLIVDVAVAGHTPASLTLHLEGQNQATAESVGQVENYTVRAMKLDPYPGKLPSANAATPSPTTDYSIPGGEYVATLVVEQTAQPTVAVAFQRIAIGATEGFIVPAQNADGIGGPNTTYWTPTEAEVRAMEPLLAGYLATADTKRAPSLAEKQATYKRQYIGIVREGRKLIYTSYLCSVQPSMDIEHSVVFVMDGGACFFQTTFDVEQQTFTELQINGNA